MKGLSDFVELRATGPVDALVWTPFARWSECTSERLDAYGIRQFPPPLPRAEHVW